MKKKLLLYIALCMIFTNVCFTNTVVANQIEEFELVERKVYSSYDITDDFDDNKVIVVIFHEYSGLDKQFSQSDFPGIDIKSIDYLTSLKNPNKDYPYLNLEEYQQIIELTLEHPGNEKVLEAIDILEDNPIVQSAEVSGQFFEVDEVTPNDTFYSLQYALTKIKAPAAWDLTTGSSEVKVGVIDTGVAYHPDLNANLLPGWDFYYDEPITHDDFYGHGTNVAGIIGASGNNGLGVSGISWNVSIVPLQAGSGTDQYIGLTAAIEAINYASANEIPIINLSFGSLNYVNSYEIAINNYSGLVCCSAGNDGKNIDVYPYYPGGDDSSNVITVANTNSFDSLDSLSNYGSVSVDLAAPGDSIYTTFNDGGYGTNSGTSFSTPLVAGTAALLLSYNPNLSAEELKYAIVNNVDPVTSLSGKVASGGRLNAYKALSSIFANDRGRIYKTRINLKNVSTRINYAFTKLSYDAYKCSFYEINPGSIINRPGSGVSQVLDNGYNTYKYSDETFPISTSGCFFESKYISRFKYTNCLQAISLDSSLFYDTNGNVALPTVELKTVLMGDVNNDYSINATDANLVLQYAASVITFDEKKLMAGDVNEDGAVNATDVLLITQYVSQIIDLF